MATIDLVESGLIYETTFTALDPAWSRSPDSGACVSATSGGLVLNPQAAPAGPVMALFSQAPALYVLEAEFDYTPQYTNDGMGLVLWASEDDAVFLSVVSGGRSYSRLRFKVAGERLEAWAYSSDGLWEMAGTTLVSSEAMPGVYAEGQTAGTITALRLVKDLRVGISNLKDGQRAVITDESNTVLAEAAASGGMVSIPVPGNSLTVRGVISIYGQDDTLIAQTALITITAGDLYWLNASDLEMYIDGQLIQSGQELFLGSLFNRQLEKRVELVNPQNAVVNDIAIQLGSFNIRDGANWVKIAPEVGGAPGEYGSQLLIDSIGPYSTYAFWIRVKRPENLPYYPYTDHHFSLVVTTGSVTPYEEP